MPTKPSIVLGITHGHGDSSAALVIDGRLCAAAEEERFTRVKHYALFPHLAVAYCLSHAKISPKDVQVVAIARQPRAHLAKKLSLIWNYPQVYHAKRMSAARSQKESLSRMLRQSGLKRARLVRIEHHLAHLMSARYLCPGDDLALLSFDGLGDFTSAACGRPEGDGIEILDRVLFPHSLGYFYTAMTQYLGFPYFGDEFKVMGLSSYGKPRYLPALRELIREEDEGFGFELNLEAFPLLKQPMGFYIENGQPRTDPFYNRALLTQIIGLPQRKPKDRLDEEHWDLAKSTQARFEEIANHMLMKLFERVGVQNLALAGGCAHNSVWVGKIPAHTPFKKIYVAPASHDAGLAVGAAIAAAQTRVVPEGEHWGLLGPDLSETAEHSPESAPFEYSQKTFDDDRSLIEWMIEELSRKKIVGLFRGRMEFGPRALGSRSILADPRWPEMKDRLNQRVKHRESFRPFAASVLWEHQGEWFKEAFFCPAMEAVFKVNEEVRHRIAGVVHADQTCRIQSITRETQPFYWELIEAFRKKTGVPMLINTSFNDCEPIVCTPKDAWNCFASCEMDHLVIGNRVYSRVGQDVALTA